MYYIINTSSDMSLLWYSYVSNIQFVRNVVMTCPWMSIFQSECSSDDLLYTKINKKKDCNLQHRLHAM